MSVQKEAQRGDAWATAPHPTLPAPGARMRVFKHTPSNHIYIYIYIYIYVHVYRDIFVVILASTLALAARESQWSLAAGDRPPDPNMVPIAMLQGPIAIL